MLIVESEFHDLVVQKRVLCFLTFWCFFLNLLYIFHLVYMKIHIHIRMLCDVS